MFLDAQAEDPAAVDFAASLAREHDAQLTGVFIQPEPPFSPPEMFVRGSGIHATIDTAHERLRKAENEGRAVHGQFGAVHRTDLVQSGAQAETAARWCSTTSNCRPYME